MKEAGVLGSNGYQDLICPYERPKVAVGQLSASCVAAMCKRSSISIPGKKRRPEIDVFRIAARHFGVMSMTNFRMRNLRPQATWSCTKSSDHRALRRA